MSGFQELIDCIFVIGIFAVIAGTLSVMAVIALALMRYTGLSAVSEVAG